MTEDENNNSAENKTYKIGDVGRGARVAQGENITWMEGVKTLPEGHEIAQMFEALIKDIAKDNNLDEDTREISKNKVEAVAEGLAKAEEDPSFLRKSLIEAKAWLASSASWVVERISSILKSEAVQKTISTLTETGVLVAISKFAV